MNGNINTCRTLDFFNFADKRGELVAIERVIPFDIKRIYYLYNSTNNELRGAHAHKELKQVFIALNGSFDIILDDGAQKITHRLDDPRKGLYVTPMLWRDLTNFSKDAICLVLASDYFDENDYIRDYNEFKKITAR